MRRQQGYITWLILLFLLVAGGGWSMYIVDRGDERGGGPGMVQLGSPESCTDCPVHPTPEPGAGLLFGVGALAVAWAIRRNG